MPSVVVGHVLNPQPGEMVLDMCAAPGGKLLHIYELMQGSGKLVAVDRSARRTAKMIKNVKGMQADESFFHILTTDSRNLGIYLMIVDLISDCKLNNPFSAIAGKDFKMETFDRILLDAPCSALGQRPKIITSQQEEKTVSQSILQKQLFSTVKFHFLLSSLIVSNR